MTNYNKTLTDLVQSFISFGTSFRNSGQPLGSVRRQELDLRKDCRRVLQRLEDHLLLDGIAEVVVVGVRVAEVAVEIVGVVIKVIIVKIVKVVTIGRKEFQVSGPLGLTSNEVDDDAVIIVQFVVVVIQVAVRVLHFDTEKAPMRKNCSW